MALGARGLSAASSWPPRCFSHCLWDIINLLCWRGSFQLRSRDPLGLPVGESGFQSTGHPFFSRTGLERQRQHPRVPTRHKTMLLFCTSPTAYQFCSRYSMISLKHDSSLTACYKSVVPMRAGWHQRWPQAGGCRPSPTSAPVTCRGLRCSDCASIASRPLPTCRTVRPPVHSCQFLV